jgi:L,D-peptidoglycan transpeptidase YkuD (ErfK/YbiS/YcfS/YnhG family)
MVGNTAQAAGSQMVLSIACFLTLTALPDSTAISAPCQGRGTCLLVTTRQHRLWQCEQSRPVAEFAVALGSGGVGKRRQGDAKVPLGEYALGASRPSASFHTFIPVGYPTQLQRQRGYSGGDVGVHGPARGFEHLPSSANTSVDWTLGCIAVGSDAEIDRIAKWVQERRVHRIVIE